MSRSIRQVFRKTPTGNRSYLVDYGHLAGSVDPLGRYQPMLREADLAKLAEDESKLDVERLLARWRGRVTFDLAHVLPHERLWLLRRLMEDMKTVAKVDSDSIAQMMLWSEGWDGFLHKRFPQAKRYGLEGSEVLIPVLCRLIDAPSVKACIVAMAHRGRLNVLTRCLGLPVEAVFAKLQGQSELGPFMDGQEKDHADHHADDAKGKGNVGNWEYTGDVLSHLAVNHVHSGKLLTMLPNSSHLEAVNPVLLGYVRRLLDRGSHPPSYDACLPVQIHGDAAMGGQGVVQETFLLSRLPGFTVGGSVHLVTNNQLGFTANSLHLYRGDGQYHEFGGQSQVHDDSLRESHSGTHCTDVAKAANVPVMHVNGDDPEAAVAMADVALAYRTEFRRDVVVDLVGYRRHGHNELDEPAFTQPQMYASIRGRSLPGTKYALSIGWTHGQIEDYMHRQQEVLEAGMSLGRNYQFRPFVSVKKGDEDRVLRMVTRAELRDIGRQSVRVPLGFNVHERLQRHHIEPRLKALDSGTGIDWATAEALAIDSLLRKEGARVRLCGQDSIRGTFSQRHAALIDQRTGHRYFPLGPAYHVINSPLSEFGVLGFEYGHSILCDDYDGAQLGSVMGVDIQKSSNAREGMEDIQGNEAVQGGGRTKLSIWEAQFGDFCNGAQVVLDAFVASGEAKWAVASNLTLLLPHGYDGAGPEHSSCRLERFLQLCNQAIDNIDACNMIVVNPTTPSQYYHVLRRQLLMHKPLVVGAPKTLLRLPAAVSTLDDLVEGRFRSVLCDNAKSRSTIVLCSGKLYYELVKVVDPERATLVRLEQLHPFPRGELRSLGITDAVDNRRIIWCQEEPRNQGAFAYVQQMLALDHAPHVGSRLEYVGRRASSAPATGHPSEHRRQSAQIIDDLLQAINP